MSNKIPAIGSIKTFQDAQRALNGIRSWLVENPALAQLSSVRGLVYVDENGNISSKSPGVDIQEVGGLDVTTSGKTVDSTKSYKITVKGTTIKLAVLS